MVFIPKYRKKLIYGELRRHLGQVLRRLSGQKESLIEEGHLLPDHVHAGPRCLPLKRSDKLPQNLPEPKHRQHS